MDTYEGILTASMVKEETRLCQHAAKKYSEIQKSDAMDSLNVTNKKDLGSLIELLTRIKKYTKYILDKMEKTVAERKLSQVKEHSRKESDDPSGVSPPKKCKFEIDYSEIFNHPKYFVGNGLRDQSFGFEWMKLMYESGVQNCVMGKDMGTKVTQCVAMLAHLIEMGVRGPFLICAPLVKLPIWLEACHRLAPKIPVLLYHGSKDERLALRKECNQVLQIDKDVQAYPTIITTAEIAFRDVYVFEKRAWKYVIVDQTHRSNTRHNCTLLSRLRQLPTNNQVFLTDMQVDMQMENNLGELLPFLNYVLPQVFDEQTIFQHWSNEYKLKKVGTTVSREEERDVADKLYKILLAFLMQRIKPNVNVNIPVKRELNIAHVPLMPW